ncbi:carboxypeptidase regulatory-like domain-containing protein [Ornithobacterium rhinotracheale]|uniref:TonB-dependent receptor n=3 Tax=Ornithobacterium rhinotracheale TaxID=28251 RepID=I4A020_ORNRL|nr:carboxypeptidase regulatory-like domain-containing protein [Ornithobacterium rhinotracheale]AFL97304.1 hypothetical protein Ornrh_1117 [Ornithobacterium rhinotracheale DSM 15997]AIQ00523.1 hypothetical protein Q785_06195 [Ornithobacterium rhinotracheale ORT-UMN 88]KGB67521.1 hypothetical protein Q787_05915 [Ornithobacterium rhinotracheale H06-030791]MBN3663035.1 carboxypeptidase-like regulatory domain-containing protein [Ornithobacterium rhinotracheale]MCK0194195.1 carboxypeptidase-like reg
MVTKKAFLLYFLVLSSWALHAQSVIKGTLSDENATPISGASVSLVSPKDEEIIAYTFSDKNGKYQIETNSPLKELYIVVSAMNFGEKKSKIQNQSQTKNFTLEGEIIQLKEIVAKSTPIRRKGDTISYDVKSFAKSQDRNLEDILKRLPGIEVEKSGRVLYQGSPINKFYVEGLDLVDGKYKIINQNLPHKEVASVQVLENHQPIKMLDSLVFSDKAALNIKLRNKFTHTGSAELGIGGSPLLWKANLSPMFFSRKRQYLLSYQTTNTGEKLEQQNQVFINSNLEAVAPTSQQNTWLSLPEATPPAVSPLYWNNNNAHLVSLNYIQKFKNDYTIRFNNSYFNDFQKIEGESSTLYFNNGQGLKVFENMKNRVFTNELNSTLKIEKNVQNYFFNNTLNYKAHWDGEDVFLQSNQGNFNQNLNSKNFGISNDLSTMFTIGKQILSVNSNISYASAPQNLGIKPGVFQELFPQSIDGYLAQNINLKHFYTNNYVGFNKGLGKFNFSNKFGFSLENKKLNTDIAVDNQAPLSDDFYNHLKLKNSLFYAKTRLETKLNRWLFSLSLPVTQQFMQWEDVPLLQDNRKYLTRFEPYFSVHYDAKSFWKYSAYVNWDQSLGNIGDLYYAYILKNYRRIERMPGILPENKTFNYGLNLEYKNPLESIFAFAKYKRSHYKSNLIYSTNLEKNGATFIDATEQDNTSESQSITLRFDKYFSDIKTNLSMTGQWSEHKSEQIFNAKKDWSQSETILGKAKLQTQFFDQFKAEYTINLSRTQPSWSGQKQQAIIGQSHWVEFIISPWKQHSIISQTEWVKNSLFSGNQTYLFSNLRYQFALQKNKIDFEIIWNNIFNLKEYKTLYSSPLSSTENVYQLRPSQILAKIKFSL